MWNRSETEIKIALIRHGTTASNREKRYLGLTDESLDETGIRDLLEKKASGQYPDVDYLFVSPMKRCKETAALIYPNTSYTEIPDWHEMDFGDFEGKNYLELSNNPDYQRWIDSNGTLPFPGGESREAFISRCVRGWEEMQKILELNVKKHTEQTTKQHTEQNMEQRTGRIMTIGCVVHGGTIMALLSHFLGGEYFDYQIPNGGVFLWVSP